MKLLLISMVVCAVIPIHECDARWDEACFSIRQWTCECGVQGCAAGDVAGRTQRDQEKIGEWELRN